MGWKVGLAGMLVCAAANASVNSDLENIEAKVKTLPEVASTQLCLTPNATQAIVHFRQGHIVMPQTFYFVIANGNEEEKKEAYEIADKFYSSVNDVQKDLYHIIEKLAPLNLYTEGFAEGGPDITKEDAAVLKYSWLTSLLDAGLLHDNEIVRDYIKLKNFEAGSIKMGKTVEIPVYDDIPLESFDYIIGAQLNLIIEEKINIKPFENAQLLENANNTIDISILTDSREDYFIANNNEELAYVLLGGAHAFAGSTSCPEGDFSNRLSKADNIAEFNAAGKTISLLEITPATYFKSDVNDLMRRISEMRGIIIDRSFAEKSSLK